MPINQQPVAEVGDRKLRKTRRNNMGGNTTPSSPDVTSGSNGGAAVGKRKGRPSDLELDNKSSKRVRCSMRTAVNVARDPSPDLIVCPEPNCNKKYRHLNGLKYHQTHAHQEPSSPRSETTADEPMDTAETKSSGSAKSGDRFDDVDKDEKVSTTGKGRGKTQSPRKVVTPSGSVKEPTNSSGASSQSRCEKDDSKVVVPPAEEKARECATASGFNDSVPSIMAGSKPVLAVRSCMPSLVAATCAGPVTIVTQVVSTTSANLVATSSTVVSAANAVIPASVTTTVIATVPVVMATVASTKDAGDRLKRCKVEKTATKVATTIMAAKPKSVIATRPLLPAPPVGGSIGAVSVHTPVAHAGFTATSQLKPIQPKPTIMGETTNVNFALTSLKELKEKKSKKKRNKERPRDTPMTSDSKPEAATRTDEPLMSVIKPVPSSLVVVSTGDSTSTANVGDVRPVIPIVSADLPKPEATVESLSQDKVDLTSSVVGKTPEPCVRSTSVQPPNTLSIISPLEVTTTDVRERGSTVQSPAYSDISDANDSAPTLENEVESKSGSAGDDRLCKVSCDQSIDQCVQSSYGICQPFYGQPPYLVPAVSQDAIHPGSGGGGSRQSTPKPVDKDGSRSKSGSPRVSGDSEERTDASGRRGDGKLASEQQREKTMQQSPLFSQYHPYMMSGNGGAVGYSNYHMPVMSHSPQYKEQQQRRQEASVGQSQSPHHRKEPTSTQAKPDKKPDTDAVSRVDTGSRTPVRSPAPKTAVPAVAPSGHAGSPVLVSSSSRGQVEKARAQEPKRAPSSESLKKKQNENHQIMKENIELKHQMPLSRGGGSVQGQQTYEPQASPANAGYDAQASPANAGYDAQFLMELQRQDVQRFYMFQQQRMLEQQRYNEMMAADGDGGAEKCTAKDLSKPKAVVRDGGDVERTAQNRPSESSHAKEVAVAAARHKNEVRARENKSASPLNMAKPVSGGGGVLLSGGGLPGSAPQYYGHPYQYSGQVPFDPARGMYPGMGPYVGYAANPMGYGVHPAAMRYHVTPMEGAVDESMMLSPNAPGMSAEGKALDLLQQHASHYYNAVPGPHKIHELKDAAKPAPGKLTPPLSSSSAKEVERPGSANSAASPKDVNGSPLLQRHLHTHHHTHVVGPPGYPMYGSFGCR